MKKRILVAVSSDLYTDQRVKKECETLVGAGYELHVYCRKLRPDRTLTHLPYTVSPLKLWREKGMGMFIQLNIRLFFTLLFARGDIIWANDLDTLLPCFLVSRLRNKKIIYDSHEYYTQTPSLLYRPFKRKIWERLERFVFPRLQYVITVNDSIRKVYEEKYGVPVTVIRNLPRRRDVEDIVPAVTGFQNKKILILQGAGIHLNRGAEEAVLAMQYLDDSYVLLIAGGGDALPILKKYVRDYQLEGKVIFYDLMLYKHLISYTKASSLGLMFEKIKEGPASLYTLPNKFFDYIHAGVPVLASRAVEVEKLINRYKIGAFIEDHDPVHIAGVIRDIFEDASTLEAWKENTVAAASGLCWEEEENILKRFMKNLENIASVERESIIDLK